MEAKPKFKKGDLFLTGLNEQLRIKSVRKSEGFVGKKNVGSGYVVEQLTITKGYKNQSIVIPFDEFESRIERKVWTKIK
jgi:hypothetical protein